MRRRRRARRPRRRWRRRWRGRRRWWRRGQRWWRRGHRWQRRNSVLLVGCVLRIVGVQRRAGSVGRSIVLVAWTRSVLAAYAEVCAQRISVTLGLELRECSPRRRRTKWPIDRRSRRVAVARTGCHNIVPANVDLDTAYGNGQRQRAPFRGFCHPSPTTARLHVISHVRVVKAAHLAGNLHVRATLEPVQQALVAMPRSVNNRPAHRRGQGLALIHALLYAQAGLCCGDLAREGIDLSKALVARLAKDRGVLAVG